jgi:hypothetical protein
MNEFSDMTNVRNLLLSKILLDEMLDKGFVVIDESDLDVRYYYNKILSYK